MVPGEPPDRVAATQKIIDGFEKKTGVKVHLVGVDEGQMSQLIMSAAASGHLPDVIGAAPMGQTWQMYSNGLLNTDIPRQIVKKLGRGTFDKNALKLTSDGKVSLGVPSDAWLQLLVYRKDDFAKAGIEKPDTYNKLVTAAKKLTTKGTTASPPPPTPRTSSPRRASRVSRSPTTASSSTATARSPSTPRSVSRPSIPTTSWRASTEPPAPRPSTRRAPPTSRAARR